MEVKHIKKKTYKQLSLAEREELYALRKAGWSYGAIGKKLGRDKGALSREVKRNSKLTKGLEKISSDYLPCHAHEKAKKRQTKQRAEAAWKGPVVYLYIREKLKAYWSPEQIAGRLTIDYPELSITTETVYQHIYHPRNRKQKLWKYLTHARKKRMKKDGRKVRRDGKIPEAISIDQRPQEVAQRLRVGDWESDNLGGKVTDKTALSTTIERKTRKTHLVKLTDRKASTKTIAVVTHVTAYPEHIRKTLTLDNGSENTQHQKITSETGMAIYFCHAYHSWEKGGVENMNLRIRRYIPKGTSIDSLSEKKIQMIEDALNNTPRKCLGFKTPNEAMQEYLTAPV